MTRDGTVRTHVVLPAELVRQIDELVGKRRRSAFIEDAVGERMKRERLRKALAATAGMLRDDYPPEWETPDTTREWLRKIRASGEERLERIWGHDDVPPGHDGPR
jgi:Arc/MetJ-type ribon-helix-helix transcriptional regulator